MHFRYTCDEGWTLPLSLRQSGYRSRLGRNSHSRSGSSSPCAVSQNEIRHRGWIRQAMGMVITAFLDDHHKISAKRHIAFTEDIGILVCWNHVIRVSANVNNGDPGAAAGSREC